ncbi:MAG: LbtU family siderophore porin, partial [bacterium]
NDTAVQLGYRKGNADFSFGFFNGDVDKTGKDDKVNCYFANASFEYAQDPYSLGFVVSYLSNMADTDGLEGAVDPAATMNDEVQGLGVSLNVNMGTWFLTAEYLAAMDDFETDLFGVSQTFKPETYNVEFGWDTGRNATVALKYEQSDDMEINDDFDLGESRYGICLAYELYDDVVLGFEYLHEKYDNVNLNKGESDAITAQLAIGF